MDARRGVSCGLVALLALAAPVVPAHAAEGAALNVARITPLGLDVPPGRQIVIEFDRPVVPLGRMARQAWELPITIAPALNCHWRWIDRQALACNLDEQDRMVPATRYKIRLAPGVRTMDGATTEGTRVWEFTTQRPGISRVRIETWRHPGVPVLRAVFNQPVTKASVENSVRLVVGNAGTRVQAAADPDDPTPALYVGVPAKTSVADGSAEGPTAKPRKSDSDGASETGREARRLWLVEPVKELPLDAEVDLHLARGLVSARGSERGASRRSVVRFHTFGEFRFLGVRCVNNHGVRLLITSGHADIDAAESMCNPLAGVALSFSSPVLGSEIKREVVFRPDLAGGRDDYDPWSRRPDRSLLRYRSHRKDSTYDVWLPERLRAFERYDVRSRRNVIDVLKSWLQGGPQTRIRDQFGRPLAQAIDLSFWTNHRNPDFKLIHRDAVLESAIDSEVPLYVTNLEQVRLDYRLVGERVARAGLSHTLHPADVQDIAFPIRLGVREMTRGETGAVFGRVTSTPPTRERFHRRFFAQVTPYQVHAKIGHFNTLVWVTDLATGEPVDGANVTVYRDVLMQMGAPPQKASSARTDDLGVAMLPGTLTLDPGLDTFRWRCQQSDRDACERLFVRVDGEQGMALLPLTNDYRVSVARVSGYQVWAAQKPEYGHIHAWGTTAQGVYRAGDTIQYKVYVRNQDNERFVPARASGYTLMIADPTGKTVHEVGDLTLNEFGALQGAYTVPETGVMGWHQFVLKSSFAGTPWWRPMRVLVTDFTPAAFRVSNGLNGDLFHPGDTVSVETSASLHSGGPYTQAETRVTVELRRRSFSSGHQVAKDFRYDTARSTYRMRIHQEVGDLAADGTHVAHVDLAQDDIVYGRLRAESAIRDDRGKYVAASASADYVGIDRLVGLRKDKWVFDEDEEAEVQFIVVNARGEPVDDTQVAIEIEHLVTKAARVRGAGNAYTTRFTEEWLPVAACSGAPRDAPLPCRFMPANPGRYRVKAGIEDTQGRPHETELLAWVAGKGRVVWREDAGHAMELVPEQDQYRVGDTARFLVKNPFPGAAALVTLERYGVIRQWQTTLQGSTPMLEFPIEPELVPGAYLSVVVFSPRIESPPVQEQESAGEEVDLGKPAFRIGYAELAVVDPYKQLGVAVVTDRDVYKPRDTVAVSLTAQPRNLAGADKEPIEYAVAVLDEAVFDLIAAGRSYFDPYKGFYSVDGLDIENYSLLTRLVGRQKIDKKGANSGGDGGAGLDMRTIFKYVGYWNPSLPADMDGKASFEFALPDNLTGWRVLALAVTPGDRFGLGDASFKTNQPTQIRPVMPNQVTEGDDFVAGFAVMNRTGAPRTLAVTITAAGDVDGDAARVSRQIDLAPYQRETVSLRVAAARLKKSRDAPRGVVRFEARAWDATDGDAVVHEIPVRKRRDLEIAADYGTIVDAGTTQPVAFPADIQPDVGEVAVILSPTVVGNVEGAFRYMRDYPYSCWEQVLSKGVMASHFGALRAYLDGSLEWPDSGELPAATLALAANYQAPNGGMAYWIPEDRNVSPYLSAYSALAFNWLREAGHAVPAPVEDRLHKYLLRLLRRDAVPSFYSRGMSSTVRAVALNALAARGKADRRDLGRYARHVETMDLFGAANFLQAALRLGGADDLASTAMDHLMARRSASGGKLAFNEELDHGYARILTTQLRSNCAILSAFSEVEELGALGLRADTAMAMTRAITQTRGNRDHWENTQENLFCLNALIDYASRWERVEPAMRVSVDFDGQTMGEGAFDDFRDPALRFSTPIKPAHPGTDTEIAIRREGAGRLYYASRITYAPEDGTSERVNAGIDVRREYAVQRGGEWVLLTDPATVVRGDLVRVDLFLELPTARNFVVVDDHVPGGLEPVDRNLATASGVDAAEGNFAAHGSWLSRFDDWIRFGASRWSFYHREVRHHAVRFYSDYLPPGRYHLSYTAQAIAAGTFAVRPAHAGEMYDLDVFGKTGPLRLTVQESQ